MDILDTFGDWLQLLFFIAIGFFGISNICVMILGLLTPHKDYFTYIKYKTLISLAVGLGSGYITWVTMYDYDKIIGLLIGTAAAWFFTFKIQNATRLSLNDKDVETNLSAALNRHACFYIAAVLILKIILFW